MFGFDEMFDFNRDVETNKGKVKKEWEEILFCRKDSLQELYLCYT